MSEKKQEKMENEEVDLRGTFVSVMFLGGFIIASWAGVWALYLYR
ncbi:MAG TPA: cytochrome c oxidase subunit 2A [Pseudogracilibacillus sp.]|nr:cytochrome c oxidase subunit 2A [Pseudogracilibacillus sp.]